MRRFPIPVRKPYLGCYPYGSSIFNQDKWNGAISQLGVRPERMLYSGALSDATVFYTTQMNQLYAQGYISYSNYDLTAAQAGGDPLAAIIAGTYDSKLTIIGNATKGRRHHHRFLHEPNTYDSGMCFGGAHQVDPAMFVLAWRHIHDVIRATGDKNPFIWNMNYTGGGFGNSWPIAPYYPGDAYVDVMSIDGYRTVGLPNTFQFLFDSDIQVMKGLSSLPIEIGETGQTNTLSNQDTWWTACFAYLMTEPRINYGFNSWNPTDNIQSITDTAAQAAFKAGFLAWRASFG